MVEHPSIAQVRDELQRLRDEMDIAAYWDRKRLRSELRRALWVELRSHEVKRRRAMKEFTRQRMLVGERILNGLYSPSSEVGNT
jgi:hypothetical protein